MGKADGESLQEFKMPEERDELFLATSKTRTKTIEKIKKKKKARIWHNKELSGGLWCVNRRRCCNKYELLAAIGIRAEGETCSVAQF